MKSVLMISGGCINPNNKINYQPYTQALLEYFYMGQVMQNLGMTLKIQHANSVENKEEKLLWEFSEKKFIKTEDESSDLLFERVVNFQEKYNLVKEKYSKKNVVNPFSLTEICDDKLLTYNVLKDLAIKTINCQTQEIIPYCDQLFSKEKYVTLVVKPRFGARGDDVQFINYNELNKLTKNQFQKNTEYIIQPFIESKGIPELEINSKFDFRILIKNKTPFGGYIRVADKNSLQVNPSCQGKNLFDKIDMIPTRFLEHAKKVAKKLNTPKAVFAIDLIEDYKTKEIKVIELNSKPGFASKSDTIYSLDKLLIDKYVELLNETK